MRVAAGILAFLFGMNLMAKSLQELDHTVLKRWITALSKRPPASFLVAALAAFLVQSSSTVTVIIIGLVAGKMTGLPQAFLLLLGANIGTAIQVPWLRSIVQAAFIIAGILSFFLWMLSTRSDQKNVGLSVIGAALVFTGLDWVVAGLGILSDYLWFTEAIHSMKPGTSAFFYGVTLTTLIQSSGISLHTLQEFLRQGAISLTPALYFMLGANVGTTSTALLSTIGGDIDAKRTGVLHVLINLFGVLLLWPVLAFLLRQGFFQSLAQGDDSVLMRAHLVFNLITSFLFIPFTGPFLRLVGFLVPSPMERRPDQSSVQPDQADERSLLLLRSDFQALYRTMWAYSKQVFHLFQSMDVNLLERTAQIREHIEQTRLQLRSRYFHMIREPAPMENSGDLMSLISVMEDMEIIYGLTYDVYLLASNRIMHQRKTDELSRVALRSQFKKTLEMVYLCAQLEKRDPAEVARALWNQEEFSHSRAVFQRNVLVASREERIDEKSTEDLLSVFRLLERINLACRIMLEREERQA